MNTQPLVSVIVPAYNAERGLGKCLGSLASQTYGNLDVVVIDDGSTDGSGMIAEEWASRDKRFRVVREKNSGVATARNTGLHNARGEYVAFVDSDDYVEPDFVETMLKALQSYGTDIAMCSLISDHAGDNDLTAKVTFDDAVISEKPKTIDAREYASLGLHNWQCGVLWNKLYKRSVMTNVRFPDGRIHEDEYAMPQILDHAKSIVLLPDRLYHYQAVEGSIMHKAYDVKRLDKAEAFIVRVQWLVSKRFDRLVGPAFDNLCVEFVNGSHLDWSDTRVHQRLRELFALFKRDVPPSCSKFLSTKQRVKFWGLRICPFAMTKLMRRLS